ncbi:hypothetical protein KNU14_gp84 [Gordonia phage Buggaboo]|uniref:Uncharacterized protein n=1 Tax=Gordonia phage Buggaboo TaxID=2315529 RepID=A0A386KDI1_9CAUD|nr:hypothetical protein KNU14_gp84 [Gordonia phage Buggaboo]AVE00736.1 hypothetical protein SEA_SUPERSULLEY_84 [Gordonia phage SuperSulley]AYD83276.1 hypothetical protein SEA_BUGGABOO_84 [Gordonia phage Buggaboo]
MESTPLAPGALSRARLDKAFLAAGWYFHTGTATGRSVDVYVKNRTDGRPAHRDWLVQIYRHPSGRVTGATLFDDDGRAYPFDSRRVVGQLFDFLAGVRFDVITYNGAVPTFGVRYGRSSLHVRPTRRSARDLARRRSAAGESVEIRRWDPRDNPAIGE